MQNPRLCHMNMQQPVREIFLDGRLGAGPTTREPRARRRAAVAAAGSAADPTFAAPSLPEIRGSPNVLVLGGTGRVGSSTASALLRAVPAVNLTLASRTEESYQAALARRPELQPAAHARCNIDDDGALSTALRGVDLVIHAAGPFQRRQGCGVLEAAIAAGVPYMDICDDSGYSQRAKALHARAQAAGVPAITTAGM